MTGLAVPPPGPGPAGPIPAGTVPPGTAAGPCFDELSPGQVFRGAPGITLTDGLASVHQSIVGQRLALPLDRPLCAAVTGTPGLAPPGLVWDIAIGQSSVVTQQVRANLFYRGLVFRRAPVLGDTLRTSVAVTAMRQNRPRAGRPPTGLVVLRITTTDQEGRPVLDFRRCAMLPLRDPARLTGHADELEPAGQPPDPAALAAVAAGWRLDRFARQAAGAAFADLQPGQSWDIAGGDVVSSAPELARLTLNIAAVHHDDQAGGGRRLVYGGHAIGLALTQAARALPGIVTVAGWHGCDHLGPVREGDTLRSTLTVQRADPLAGGGGLVHLRSVVRADGPNPADGPNRADGPNPADSPSPADSPNPADGPGRADGPAQRPVLDWRFVVIMA